MKIYNKRSTFIPQSIIKSISSDSKIIEYCNIYSEYESYKDKYLREGRPEQEFKYDKTAINLNNHKKGLKRYIYITY